MPPAASTGRSVMSNIICSSGVGTLPLLQIMLDMTDRPVLAAGGIVTGRGLAAVLAAGAGGAWIGTPFLLASESRTTAAAQQRVIGSDETQTVRTRVYDRLQHTDWTPEFAGRALRNPFVDRWNEHEDDLLATPEAVQTYERAKAIGDFTTAQIYAGQSVGMLDRVRPAKAIVEELATGAIACLQAARDIVQ